MRDRKIVIDGLTTQDFEIMETNFSNMAKKGFLIEKIKFGVSFYKRIQPKDISFAIGICPKPKAYEKPDPIVVADYIERQEKKGWKHLFSQEHTHVFINENDQEIEGIDKTTQIDNIKSTLKLEIISFFILTMLNIFNITRMSGIEIYHFSSNMGLISLLILPIITIFFASNLLYDIYRYIRLNRKNSNDEIQIKNITWIKVFRKASFLLTTMLLLLFLVAILSDAFISGTKNIVIVLPTFVAFFVAFKLRDFFTGRNFNTGGKVLIAFFIIFGILIVSVVIGFQAIPYGSDKGLPEKYSAIKLEDIGFKERIDEGSFRKEGSILMPLSYSYTEHIYNEWPDSLYISNQISKGLNKDIADYIFQLELKNSTRFYGKLESAKEFYPFFDEALFLVREGREISEVTLKKGLYIFIFSGDFNLQEEETIQLINKSAKEVINRF